MSVVSGKIIFCEGKQSSLDISLLNKVFESILIDKPTIVPAGSKFTFSVFAEGYFSGNRLGNQKYIVFRDRDFDIYPTGNIQLIESVNSRGKTSAYLTHRACIENYLLDPNLIHSYWMSKYIEKQVENPNSMWGHGDSPGVEAIKIWIENSARSLQDYQTVRWALADLLKVNMSRLQLKTTWTGGSGQLPFSLNLQDCETQAKNLVNAFIQGSKAVTEEKFKASLIKYQHQFIQPEFWQNQHYLIWFHGKDLQKRMMQIKEPKYISLDKFFEWAIANIDITQHPDLMQLRTIVESL